MTLLQQVTRTAAASATALLLAACAGAGGQLGDILGSVLGGGGGAGQVAGTVRGVDTRNQQIALQQSNGQTVGLLFDNNTQVIYQNRSYAVTSLENGDQVTARVQQRQDGSYYTDSVQVTQPVNSSSTGATGSSNVQALQGTVRQIDRNNGLFTVDTGNNVILTVSLPANASNTDINRFNNLRSGEFVRFYGVYVTTTRVELRQFN